MVDVMKKHKRSKQTLAEDSAYVLNSPLHIETKKSVLNGILWAWTEYDGKYQGCQYWTVAAIERRRKMRSNNGLRHEHVVPRKYLVDLLLGLEQPADETIVFGILDRFAIGAVVTVDEERELNGQHRSSMPSEFTEYGKKGYKDAWLRFKGIRLEVVEREGTGTGPKK